MTSFPPPVPQSSSSVSSSLTAIGGSGNQKSLASDPSQQLPDRISAQQGKISTGVPSQEDAIHRGSVLKFQENPLAQETPIAQEAPSPSSSLLKPAEKMNHLAVIISSPTASPSSSSSSFSYAQAPSPSTQVTSPRSSLSPPSQLRGSASKNSPVTASRSSSSLPQLPFSREKREYTSLVTNFKDVLEASDDYATAGGGIELFKEKLIVKSFENFRKHPNKVTLNNLMDSVIEEVLTRKKTEKTFTNAHEEEFNAVVEGFKNKPCESTLKRLQSMLVLSEGIKDGALKKYINQVCEFMEHPLDSAINMLIGNINVTDKDVQGKLNAFLKEIKPQEQRVALAKLSEIVNRGNGSQLRGSMVKLQQYIQEEVLKRSPDPFVRKDGASVALASASTSTPAQAAASSPTPPSAASTSTSSVGSTIPEWNLPLSEYIERFEIMVSVDIGVPMSEAISKFRELPNQKTFEKLKDVIESFSAILEEKVKNDKPITDKSRVMYMDKKALQLLSDLSEKLKAIDDKEIRMRFLSNIEGSNEKVRKKLNEYINAFKPGERSEKLKNLEDELINRRTRLPLALNGKKDPPLERLYFYIRNSSSHS